MKQFLTLPDGSIPPGVDVALLEAEGVRIVRPTEVPQAPGMVAVEAPAEEREGIWWQVWRLEPAPPHSPVIPAITRRQLRLWLLAQGRTDADVRAAIEAIADPTERAAALIEWEDSSFYERSHPLIGQIGPALGFTAEQMDAGFIEAAMR